VAPARSASADEPRWRLSDVWRQPQGLAQDSVLSMIQTRDGYIWIGTRGGLSRFDGVRFTNFDDRDRDQLRETEVWALAETADGSLWIGTFGGGVSRLKDGRFTVYTTADGLVDDTIRAMASDGRGGVFIGTERGISHWSGGRFRNYGTADGLAKSTVVSLYLDSDGTLWISGSGDGLYRLKHGTIEAVELPAPRPVRIEDFLRDREGALWFATHSGLYRLAHGTMRRFTRADGLSSDWIRRLAEDREGRVFVITDKGLDHLTRAEPPAPPFRNEVETSADAILPDREGSLWLGYMGAGVAHVHESLFVSFAEKEGLADSNVFTVLEDSTGNLWIGTRTGLFRFRDGVFTAQPYLTSPPSRSVTALREMGDGHLWRASRTGG
jgi:ligand-binding sensor domain-containing protein